MAANSVYNHVSVEVSTTGTAGNSTVNIKKILWLKNTGNYSILVNFDNSTLTAGASGCFTLEAKSQIIDLDINVGTIYYKTSSSNTSTLCLLGIPDNDVSGY